MELFRQRMLRVSAFTVFALLLFLLDPLQIDKFRLVYLDGLLQRSSIPRYVSKGQRYLAVILIDEQSLALWHEDWPLSLDRFRGIIHRLACDHVSSAFFDMFPSRVREAPKDAAKNLEAAIDGSSPDPVLCEDGVLPDGIDISFGKANVLRDASEDLAFPLLKTLDVANRRFWIQYAGDGTTYPVGQDTFPKSQVSIHDMTPAFGVLRRQCARAVLDRGTPPVYCNTVPLPGATQPLEIRWNAEIDPQQNLLSREVSEECAHSEVVFNRVAFAFDVASGGTWARCPPILTLSAGQLYDGSVARAESAGGLAPGSLLRDRIVLIGTMLSGVNDWINTPIHGALPGVYVHAMALDNLITLGPHYPTEPSQKQLIVLMAPLFFTLETAREYVLLPRRRQLGQVVAAGKQRNRWPWGKALAVDLAIAFALPGLIVLVPIFGSLLLNWSINFTLFVILKISLAYVGALVASLAFVKRLANRLSVKHTRSTRAAHPSDPP